MRRHQAENLLHQVKATYDSIAHEFSDSREFPWPEFHFFSSYLEPGARILDLGCGNGRLLKYLQVATVGWDKPAFNYCGIDNSEKLLEKARKLHPQQTFCEGDQLAIPLADQSVDLLFNIAAFHHIPTKALQQKALSEMRRVLSEKGVLIMTVWNLWQKRYWKSTLAAVARTIFTIGNYRFGDRFIPWGKAKIPRYYYAFLPNEFERIVEQAGFEIMEFFFVCDGQKVHFRDSHNLCLIARKRPF